MEVFFPNSGSEDGMAQNPETIEEKIKYFSHLKWKTSTRGKKKSVK